MIRVEGHPGEEFSVYRVIGAFEIHNKDVGWMVLPIGSVCVLRTDKAREGLLRNRLVNCEAETNLLSNTVSGVELPIQ